MLIVVVLVMPVAALIWAACLSMVLVRGLIYVGAAWATDPHMVRASRMSVVTAVRWAAFAGDRSTARGRWTHRLILAACIGLGVVVAWVTLVICCAVVGLPAAFGYSVSGISIAGRPGGLWKFGVWLAPAVLLFVGLKWLRGALRQAGKDEVDYLVEGRGSGPLGKAAVRERRMARQPDRTYRRILLLRWPEELVDEPTRRSIAARCYLHENAKMPAAFIPPLMIWAIAAHCFADVGKSLSRPVQVLLVVECLLLLMASFLAISPAMRIVKMPRHLSIQMRLLSCLVTVPEQTVARGWRDPLGTHRIPLDSIARDLQHEARSWERRGGLTGGAGHPYAVILRGVAREITSFTVGRESLGGGQLSDGLELMLRRTVAVMAGTPAGSTALQELADTVRAFGPDGSPDPELAGSAVPWIVRVAHALLAQLEMTNRVVTALSALAISISACILVLVGHLGLDAIPTWLK